jgi:hypothetical protein
MMDFREMTTPASAAIMGKAMITAAMRGDFIPTVRGGIPSV